jgi:RNA polymerase sigma factor (sigma-70 family)
MSQDLDSLFRLYHGELSRVAQRCLGDREAAADVVQDAFVRYATLSGRGASAAAIRSPRRFLWRVVANLIIDLRRGARRRGHHAPLDQVVYTLADPKPSPERQLELNQELTILHAALNELPEKCRQALLLNRMEGLTHEAVARRLGVSSSMVSKYIMRGFRHCVARLVAASR